MAVVVGSNNSALKIGNNLAAATDRVSRVFERLASGARINRASDDPAGLSAASILEAKARVLGKAQRNINDGVSLLQIADSATSLLTDLVTRMSELAAQAANGAFSSTQRASLNREFQQLGLEVQRITESTSFNGIQLLKGTKSARGAERVGQHGFGSLSRGSTNGDGRYFVASNSSGLTILDDITGETRQIAAPSGYSTVTGPQALVNGDVAFVATNSTTGYVDIFYYTYQTGETRQLTNSHHALDANTFSITPDGTKLLFASLTIYNNNEPVSTATTAGPPRYNVLDLQTGLVTAALAFVGGLGTPAMSISANGQYVALSRPDFNQIVVGSLASGTFTSQTISGNGTLHGITDQGRLIFSSSLDLLGGNPDLNIQLFSYNFATGITTQLTSLETFNNFSLAALSLDNSKFYFLTAGDVTGENPSGVSQVFELNLLNDTITQLTSFTTQLTGLTGRALSRDGSRLYMSSTSNIFTVDITPGSNNVDLEVGYGSNGNIIGEVRSAYSAVRGLSAHTLNSVSGARLALDRTRENLKQLTQSRGIIGAGLSRLSVAYSLTRSQAEEITSARGRIVDADVAMEAGVLARTRVTQDAAAALLGQANQQPALAIALLGNL